MGWDSNGGYNRQRNFSSDASAGVKILASAMDQEFNDFASAMTVAVAKDGQNIPTANLPMGGFRHLNVGAALSATNYLRVQEYIKQVPIYVEANNFTDGVVSASVSVYTTVSAGQAPPDGAKLVLKFPSSFAQVSVGTTIQIALATPTGSYTAKVTDEAGTPLQWWSFAANGNFEFMYSSANSSFQALNYLHGRATGTRGISFYSVNAAGTSAGTALDNLTDTKVINNGRLNTFEIERIVAGSPNGLTCSVSAYRMVITMQGAPSLCGSEESSVNGSHIPMIVSGVPVMCTTVIHSASIDIVPISPVLSAGAVVSIVPCVIMWDASGVKL